MTLTGRGGASFSQAATRAAPRSAPAPATAADDTDAVMTVGVMEHGINKISVSYYAIHAMWRDVMILY